MTHGKHSHHEVTRSPRFVNAFYGLLPRANDEVYAEFRDKPATQANYLKLYFAIYHHTPEEAPDPLAGIGLKKVVKVEAVPEWMLEECTCTPRADPCPFCRTHRRQPETELEF